jgi:predicted Zn-dependent protease with MMP-like domain
MTEIQFEKLVQQVVETIPLRFRCRMHDVIFRVVARPTHPDTMALFEGLALADRNGAELFRQPPIITIFQEPHEEAAESWRHLEKLVTDSVLHEVAHYFGMDEQQVSRWERRRLR